GFGYGLLALAGGKIVSGYELVARTLRLPERLAAAQAVLTGEGRFDRQTAFGKGPGALAKEARALGKHTVLFAGAVAPGTDSAPFDEVVEVSALAPPGVSHAEALRHAGAWWASRGSR
ncbi:MAG TPA: glycerate kinase, partial [Archangium sp.]|nr:glycerate kinase [Archangium sp.]